MDNFSDRLKKILSEKMLKQTDLARMTGIDKSLISNYISGKYKAKQDNLYLIAQALNVSEAWLMGYDVPPDRIPDEKRLQENTPKPLPSQIDLSPHEKALVSAYRENPSMQSAVDKLLGIDTIDSDITQDMIETVRAGSSLKKRTNTK